MECSNCHKETYITYAIGGGELYCTECKSLLLIIKKDSMKTKEEQLRHDAVYNHNWGNYKSDKNKSRKIVMAEITDILYLGSLTIDDLLEIKNLAKKLGFGERN